MSNKRSNFPSNQLNNLSPDICGTTVSCLLDLAATGKPKDISELTTRINSYFTFCAERDMRPGIEALCLALGVSRMTLYDWCRGKHCSEEWSEECRRAKQFILTFLEVLTMNGKLNPANSIFYLKNWGHYVDQVVVESSQVGETKKLTAADLPKLSGFSSIEHAINDV